MADEAEENPFGTQDFDVLSYPIHQAAHTAQQLVREKLALQTLLPVLKDLSNRQNLVRGLAAKREALDGEISAKTEERERLVAEFDRKRKEMEARHEALLSSLKFQRETEEREVERLTTHLKSVREELQTAEQQLATVRATALQAARAVG